MHQFRLQITTVIFWAAFAPSVFADEAIKKRPGIAFRLAEFERADGLQETAVPKDGRKIFLHPESVLTDKDVTRVSFARDANGLVSVGLEVEAAAAKRLAAATKSHLGKPMAILLDGKVITAPVVRSEISAKAQITGKFSDAELMRMFSALVLHSEVPSQGN